MSVWKRETDPEVGATAVPHCTSVKQHGNADVFFAEAVSGFNPSGAELSS